MTPEQKRFEAVLKERLAERARLLIGADQRVVSLLRDAQLQISLQLAQQPADWKLWQLTRLKDQIGIVLAAAGQQAGTATDLVLRDAWQQGEDLVDKPLGAAGQAVELRLAALDARVLAAMRTFAHERLNNVAAEAQGKIGQQLGLVTVGGITPFQAIKAIQAPRGTRAALVQPVRCPGPRATRGTPRWCAWCRRC